MTGSVSSIWLFLAAGLASPTLEIEARFRDYLAAVELQPHGEWKAALGSRFDSEIVSVRGDRLIARVLETNGLYSALHVDRVLVSEYVLEAGAIRESEVLEVHERGRPWDEARRELEAWLLEKPPAEVSGLFAPEGFALTAESGRRLAPFLQEWKRLTDEARGRNEPVVASLVEALNRHDVDAQFGHYASDMVYLDQGRRIPPDRQGERSDREFEAANGARWSYEILGAGLDSLELVVTEDMEFYRALGVGARSHRARYRFREGKIIEAEAREWSEAGRPYRGARDLFVEWLKRERPEAAEAVLGPDGLRFGGRTARRVLPLVSEWRRVRPCRLYHPALSPTGTRLVVSSDCEGPWGIYVMDEDGSRARRVSDRAAESRFPRWSPDGKRVVFQSQSQGQWDLFDVGPDGGSATRLTDHPANETTPAFSPDGSRILFNSDRGGANELFWMPAEGGDAVPITRGKAPGFRPIVSPDGEFVLYRGTEPPSDDSERPGRFYRVRLDGSELGAVPGGPRHEYNPAISPDGRVIAFDAHRRGGWDSDDGLWEVWTMNADGSGRRPLTSNAINDWGPSWSPDGRSIVFLSGMNDVYDVYAMDADGSNVRRLTRWTESP
jgi:TolB protein